MSAMATAPRMKCVRRLRLDMLALLCCEDRGWELHETAGGEVVGACLSRS